MILFLIGLSVCAQLLLYILFRKQRYMRIVILLLFLFLHFYLLPQLFTDQVYAGEDAPRCGMAAIGIYFLFWTAGGSMTLIMHLCYWLATWKISLKKRNGAQEIL